MSLIETGCTFFDDEILDYMESIKDKIEEPILEE